MGKIVKAKKIAILQSNYIPWKGYFDIINSVDEFIIYDEAQYTRRDWRNRNIIKTKDGLKWLTIPVQVKGKYNQKINETRISNNKWALKHWETIRHSYSSSLYYDNFCLVFEKAFHGCKNFDFLHDVNIFFIKLINSILGIRTSITESTQYVLDGNRNDRIISICKQANANIYYSGPSAKEYIDEESFAKEGIKIEWVNYCGYPEYLQHYPPFSHYVSVLDVIFNCGDNSKVFMKDSNQ